MLRKMKVPTRGDMAEYYGAPNVMWKRCHYSGEEPRDRDVVPYVDSRPVECRFCNSRFSQDELVDGKYPEHERLLDIYEQVEERLGDLAETLGWSRWDLPIIYVRAAATKREGQSGTVDGMMAIGLNHLALLLQKRSVATEIERATSALMSLSLDSNAAAREAGEKYGYSIEDGPQDDVPFFTEAVLYPLVGKDDARTILAYVRKIQDATAATRGGD